MGYLTAVFILKAIIINIFLAAWFLLSGRVVVKLLKLPNTSFPVVEGFIFTLAVFQILTTPLLVFHLSFSLAYFFLVLLLLFVVCLSIKWKLYRNPLPQQGKTTRCYKIFLITALFLVLFQAGLSSTLNFPSADDMFYVGLAKTNLDAKNLYALDPTTGDPRFAVMDQYRFGSWELFLSVISKIFVIEPAALFHSIIPFLLIVLSYVAYSILAQKFLSREEIPLFIIFLSLFHILGGYTTYSQGTFLLTRIWQGKAIILHILLPILWSYSLDYFSRPSKSHIGFLAIIGVAGISLNPIAVFLLAVPLVFFLAGYFLLIKKVIISYAWVLLALIPLGVYGLGIKVGIDRSQVFNDPSGEQFFNHSFWVDLFIGNGWLFFIIYFVVMLWFFYRGNQKEKLFFYITPILYFLVLWNPYTGVWVAKYLTSYATYWRLFWLLPLGIGISVGMAKLLDYQKWSLILILVFFLVFSSYYNFNIYSNQEIFKIENIYKIPSTHLELAHYLEQNHPDPVLILADEETGISIRQISNKVRLFWSRTDYIKDFLLREGQKKEYRRRLDLILIYGENNRLLDEELKQELATFGINYVVVPLDNDVLITRLEGIGLNIIANTSGHVIFAN